MTWADQQRRVPPGGATWSERQGRRDWVAAGPGPFGITDVGLPPASGTLAGLLHREAEASVTPAGLGLPPTRFLQQPPGSVSFLDAENEAGASALTRTGRASSPAASPAWRWGPGGGLPVGLRAPSGPAYAATVFQPPGFSPQAVTGFDPAWGEPPHVDALTWNPERLLYEPDDEGMRLERGYLKAFYEHFRDMASRQVYVQAYREGAGTASWAYRWVRATTPWPEQGSPYEVLGPYEQYALDTTGQRPTYPVLAESTGPGQGLPYEQRTAVTLTPRPYAGPELRIDTPGYGRLPPPERALSDYAWVPQNLLPKGCPYSEPYLPVPLPDYTSGRWLEPDYTPSYPLPRPYDQLPAWRCGVVGTPGHERGKPPKELPRVITSDDVRKRRAFLLGLALDELKRREMELAAEYAKYIDKEGNLLVDVTWLTAEQQLDLDELMLARETIRARTPTPEHEGARAQSDLERRAALLREELEDSHLTPAARARVESELRKTLLALGKAVIDLQRSHEAGSLPGLAPSPSPIASDGLSLVRVTQNAGAEVEAELRRQIQALQRQIAVATDREVAFMLQSQLATLREALDGLGGEATVSRPSAAPRPESAPMSPSQRSAHGQPPPTPTRSASPTERAASRCDEVIAALEAKANIVSNLEDTLKTAQEQLGKAPAHPGLAVLRSHLAALAASRASDAKGVGDNIGRAVSALKRARAQGDYAECDMAAPRRWVGRADLVVNQAQSVIVGARAYLEKTTAAAALNQKIGLLVAAIATGGASLATAGAAFGRALLGTAWELVSAGGITGPALARISEDSERVLNEAVGLALLVEEDESARRQSRAAVTVQDIISDEERRQQAEGVGEPVPLVPAEVGLTPTEELAVMNAALTGTEESVAARLEADRTFVAGTGGSVDKVLGLLKLGNDVRKLLPKLGALAKDAGKGLKKLLTEASEDASTATRPRGLGAPAGGGGPAEEATVTVGGRPRTASTPTEPNAPGKPTGNRSAFRERYLGETGGRWGGRTTRELNDKIATNLEREFPGAEVRGDARTSEEWIPGPGGGREGGTFVDITAKTPDGRTIRVQTVDTLADGVTPTPREAAAAARIRAQFPGDELRLVPKPK